MCKKADIISMHPDDNKEGWFLHKRIWCDETGWHEKLDPRYVADMLQVTGVEYEHIVKTPVIKETVSKRSNKPLSPQEHTTYRSGAGLAQ